MAKNYLTYMGLELVGAPLDDGANSDPNKYPAVYYIDGDNGDDSADGLTPDSAWRTMARAAQKWRVSEFDTRPPNQKQTGGPHDPWTSAVSGSAFLFKRGSSYAGTFDVNPIRTGEWSFENRYHFGTYGIGERPTIICPDGSANAVKLYANIYKNGERPTISMSNLYLLDPNRKALGMFLNGSADVRLDGVEIDGFASGITADGVKGFTMDGCVVANCHTPNDEYHSGGVAGGGVDIAVRRTTLLNNGIDRMFDHNAYFRECTGFSFEENLSVGGANTGLVIHGYNLGVVVRGNRVRECSNGIGIGSGYSRVEKFELFTVEDNIIENCGFGEKAQGYGMLLNGLVNSTIRSNIVRGNRLGAAVIGDALQEDSQNDNLVVRGNVFEGRVTITGLLSRDLALIGNVLMSYDHALAITATFPDSVIRRRDNIFIVNRADSAVQLATGKLAAAWAFDPTARTFLLQDPSAG